MRKIKTITVSVNYLDFLEFSHLANKAFIKDFTVITSKSDSPTQNFCEKHNINYYQTDAFFKNGCHFNKAEAMNEYLHSISLEELDWILFLDSDIVLNADISEQMHNKELDYNKLYGCARNCYNTKKDFENNNFDHEPCRMWGFFHLFHKNIISNKHEQKNSILYNGSSDASQYDSIFVSEYFGVGAATNLDVNNHTSIQSLGTVDHLGPHGQNWKGRISESW